MPGQRTPVYKSYRMPPRVHHYNRAQLLVMWVCGAVIALMLTLVLVKAILGVPNSSLPNVYAVGKGVAIYDRNNNYVATVYADKDRKPITLAQVSTNMRKAVLAAEDHNFFKHHGIDVVGIGRAMFANVRAGHVVEGGSTITQQLVRNLYLDAEDRSLKRKLAEALLAFDVENKYSKTKILETYLNEVYFGNGVYGIERASQAYFNKHASDLTVGEAAFLAGLIKAPSDLGASMNRDAAIRRQDEVLDKMVAYGYVAEHDADVAKQQHLRFARGNNIATPYPYYVAAVLHSLSQNLPEDQVWGKGLRVYTYLDQDAQKAAESILNRGINAAPHGINQGALVCESVKDGSVMALVGGVGDYRNHQFNRALAPHTVGSAFKPFVYLAATIQSVLKPESSVDDSPISFNLGFGKLYSPKNFDGKFLGTLSVRDALALSRNVCAVRVADAVGLPHIMETARAAGITARLDNNISLALGTCAISPLEMASAYGTLARYGLYITPRLIREVDSAHGPQVRPFPQTSLQTLPQEPTCEIVDVMKDVVQRGTGVQARLNNIAVAGKTGTADKSRDIWFVGFTPDTVTAVWGGNDRYLPVRGNVTGGVVMAKIWHDFMTNFYRSHPAPADGFIPPKTPFMQQPSSSINSSVVNDAQQYEEGLKDPPLPDPSESAHPDQGSNDGSVPAEQSSSGGGSPGASGAGSPDAAQPGVQDSRSHYVHDYDWSVDQQPQSDSSERVDQPNEQKAPRADSAPRSDQQGNNQLPPTAPGPAVPNAMPAPAPAPSPDRQPSEDARRSLERPLGYGENTQ